MNAYGVVDLESFAAVTHKFEERYDELLVGPRTNRELYRERSPINHLDKISAPVLTLQGLDDKVVPPSQSELLVEALARKGIPHAYLAFEGEGHGFRREETVRRMLEASLYFLSRVFSFTPADAVEPIAIANL